MAVGVCALGFVLGVVAHGVKVARVVGLGVAVVVRPDVVRGLCCPWVRSCSDQGEGVRSVWRVYSRHRICPDCERCAPGLSRCKIQYIYNVLGYYQTKIILN